jgi:hypothetical protein
MSAFLKDAEKIFESARMVSGGDNSQSDLAIIINRQGGIQFVEATGWHLGSLEANYGARTVYRVSRGGGKVRVEGKSGSETCILESRSQSKIAQQLFGGRGAHYLTAMVTPAWLDALPMVTTTGTLPEALPLGTTTFTCRNPATP